MPPQLEVGRCTPKPSRLSWASAMSANPMASDTATMSGDATLGRMRLRRIRPGFVPIECDASMNVSSRTASVCARVRRAEAGDHHQRDGEDRVLEPGAEHAGDREREDERREAGEAVHDPHQGHVGAAAAEPGEQPERHREQHREADDLEARSAATPGAP